MHGGTVIIDEHGPNASYYLKHVHRMDDMNEMDDMDDTHTHDMDDTTDK